MKKLRIEAVKTKKQTKQFVNLPKTIYANDELWIPPLWLLEHADHKEGANPVLRRSEHVLFLAYKNELPVGRIIVYIDPRYNAYYKTRVGMFGSFESIEDLEVSSLLFSTAETWLLQNECKKIIGPINPVAESWGFLMENPTYPVFMSPHNPLYYNEHASKCGYTKAKDLLIYEADTEKGYQIPERFINFSEKILQKRPNLTVRNINRKDLYNEAAHIKNILNNSLLDNWGFVPVEDDEMADIVDKLKLILDERAICFVEDDGKPIAIALGFPDINPLFKKIHGHLTPAGIIRLITGRKKIHNYRLWGLAVLPEYHGQGLDVLLYVSLARQLTPFGVRMEANYMLEDNKNILNALEKMEMTEIKKYRVYEKELRS